MTDYFADIVPAFFALHQQVYGALTGALRHMASGGNSVFSAFLFALALGALHALTPGHGKAVLVSYFMGRDAQPLAGVWAGIKVAVGHSLVAVLLVTFFASTVNVFGRPSGAAAVMEIVAYAAIAASGLWLLVRAARRAKNPLSEAEHPSEHSAPALAGLIPCPLTMLLLVYALTRADLWTAALLLIFLAVGIALTLSTIAVAVVLLRRMLMERMNASALWFGRLIAGLEIASAATIAAIGIVFLWARLI